MIYRYRPSSPQSTMMSLFPSLSVWVAVSLLQMMRLWYTTATEIQNWI